jgi:protein-disulfide isomerase
MKGKYFFRWFSVAVILVAVIGLVSVGLARAGAKKDDINSLPTLMEAKGSVQLTVGDFKLEKQPYIGDPNAPVKVIEFYDFKCPACAMWENESYADVKKEYIDTGKVQLYAINFPFLGPDSIEAALVVESVYKQNPSKYWELKNLIYRNQGKESDIWATESYLMNLAKENIEGLDLKQLKRDLKKKTYLFDVKEDFKISAANGVYGTPTFIVNGVKVEGGNEQLKEAVNKQLQQ